MDWNKLPDEASINRVMAGLKERGFNPLIFPDRAAALARLKQLIPAGSDVMTGSSTTLEEIGFTEYLRSREHPWKNWKDMIYAEKEAERQLALRRQATTAGYFLGSVQVLTESGEALGVDATGSRQGGYVYAAAKVIWVVGINKIVPDMAAAFRRLREHCVPLENERIRQTGGAGTTVGKIVLYERESLPGRVTTLLIREKLGF